MDRCITTEEEILAALNEPFGNNMGYDSEIEDSDENKIDNIKEYIVEDGIQEIDSEEDYMPPSESESETEFARNVTTPPAKGPRRDIATTSSSSDSSIYITTKNILKCFVHYIYSKQSLTRS
jgi:hypothetical protein